MSAWKPPPFPLLLPSMQSSALPIFPVSIALPSFMLPQVLPAPGQWSGSADIQLVPSTRPGVITVLPDLIYWCHFVRVLILTRKPLLCLHTASHQWHSFHSETLRLLSLMPGVLTRKRRTITWLSCRGNQRRHHQHGLAQTLHHALLFLILCSLPNSHKWLS